MEISSASKKLHYANYEGLSYDVRVVFAVKILGKAQKTPRTNRQTHGQTDNNIPLARGTYHFGVRNTAFRRIDFNSHNAMQKAWTTSTACQA